MADSVAIYFPIPRMSREDSEACNFQYEAMRGFNNKTAHKPFYRWIHLKSPLSGAGYKVISVLSHDRQRLAGYLVSVNVPACTIGHNYLLVNGVPFAAKIAHQLLIHWLLTEGATQKAVHALQFQKAQLNSVTLTYLMYCVSRDDAQAARLEFARHSEAVQNKKVKGKPPAFSVGTSGKSTSYIKKRDYAISAYVKDGPVEGAFADFPTLADEAVVRTEAVRYLRVEIELHGVWLAANGLDSVDRWVLENNEQNPYEQAFKLIRKELRLDDGLRRRAPKEEAICELREPDQTFVRWHLAGKDVRHHPLVMEKETVQEQNSYFSAIKQRLMKKLKIDISIGWVKQSKHLSDRLAALIAYTGDYAPPPHLADKVYSRASAPACVEKLEALIDKMIAKG